METNERKLKLTDLGRSLLCGLVLTLVLTLFCVGYTLANEGETAPVPEAAETAPAETTGPVTENGNTENGAIDLSALTDDELTALLSDVHAEISARKIQKTATLSIGSYVAGEDLPAGKYLYTCLGGEKDHGIIRIVTNRGEGDRRLYEHILALNGSGEPTTLMFTLSDGDQLYSPMPFTLTVNPVITFE